MTTGTNGSPRPRGRRSRLRNLWLGFVGAAGALGIFGAGALYSEHRQPPPPQEIRIVLDKGSAAAIGAQVEQTYHHAPYQAEDPAPCPPALGERLQKLEDTTTLVAYRDEINGWYRALPEPQQRRYENIKDVSERQVDLLKFLAGCLEKS